MMKTRIILVRAAEYEGTGLTRLGQLQAGLFADEIVQRGLHPTHIMAAADELDSWATAHHISGATHCGGVQMLKSLTIPNVNQTFGAEIARLIQRHPKSPVVDYSGEPEWQALYSHSTLVIREMRGHISFHQPRCIVICSRHGHILSNLAFAWVSDMIFARFRMCSGVTYPVDRLEFCSAARDIFLDPGQGLTFRYDASDPEDRMVAPIEYLNPHV